MHTNSENPIVGKAFQRQVRNALEKKFKQQFYEEVAVDIGNPPKPHCFDVISEDGRIIVECKCYTWTTTGNVPSAKIATLDEAVLYMHNVPAVDKKIIVLNRAYHDKRQETLADFFLRMKGHLLKDVLVWEFDGEGFRSLN